MIIAPRSWPFWVLALLLGWGPAVALATPSPAVMAIVSQVQGTNLTPQTDSFQDFFATLPVNQGDQRGYSGTSPQPDLLAARTTIYDRLSALLTPVGGSVSYQSFTQSGYTGYNIVGVLPGYGAGSTQQYILGAHYDAVQNPGASDNGSGVAGVLEAAYVLSRYQFQSSLYFIAFDLEEKGLWGSNNYAALAKAANADIKGMISLDMIAYNYLQHNLAEICISSGEPSTALQNQVDQAYADYTSLSTNLRSGITGSDHSPFAGQGYPGVLVIEELQANGAPTNPYYHQPTDYYLDSNDQPNTYNGLPYIDFAYAEQMTRGAVGWIAGEAILVPEPATILLFGPAAFWMWWRRRRSAP